MSRLDGLWHRLHVLVRGDEYAGDVSRELRFHRELDALAQMGNSLGNETYYREEVREMTLLVWLDRLRQDLSYAVRGLRRSPTFTITVIALLALGLGVNAALYSFLEQLFSRPPAGVQNAAHVHRLYLDIPSVVARGQGAFPAFNYPRFRTLKAAAAQPGTLAAFTPPDRGTIETDAVLDSARSIYASPEYFPVLGLRPALGRFFTADEGAVETPTPVAVISERLWRRDFSGSGSVLGRVVTVGDRSVTIVGVAPEGFTGTDLDAGDVWLPLNMLQARGQMGKSWYEDTGNYLRVIVRLDSVADEARLLTASVAALRDLPQGNDPRDTATTLVTGPINEASGPGARQREVGVAIRLAAVALVVLLVACANLANLLIVRATQRQHETAIRRALGVSRGRLVQQMLTESLMLCVVGAAAALPFALWTGAALRHLLLPNIHFASGPLDWRVVAATIGVACLVAIVVGLIPAWGATSLRLEETLRARVAGRDGRAMRIQNFLLAFQAALSVVLVFASGLVVRSFQNIRAVDVGYAIDNMLIVSGNVRDPAQAKSLAGLLPGILARTARRPGVRAAAMANVVPMAGFAFTNAFLPGNSKPLDAAVVITSGDYFGATGVRIVRGRGLSEHDIAGNERVAVVSEAMARAAWPNESPVGKCLAIGAPTASCTRVVGVSHDVHRMNILENAQPQFYLPAAQAPLFGQGTFILRVDGQHAAAIGADLRAELLRVAPRGTTISVRTMLNVLDRELRPWRMGAILFASLGALALAVASVGIYGVAAYAVAQRTQEIGVRMALGARTHDVVRLALAGGVRAITIGMGVGAVISYATGHVIRSLLFGVVANDPATMVGAVVMLMVVGLLACLAPAWRAGHIDPVIALRAD